MCVSPLKAIILGENPDTHKKILRVVPKDYDFKDNDVVIPISCGKCIECRLAYSRNWADRMMAEAGYYNNNCFLTLTYDNDHLPDPLERYNEKGELEKSPVHPLVKRDLQLFMKRLRKSIEPEKVRFFAAGEYGDTSFRPHYHLILFGYAPKDIKLLYKKDGLEYYISESISKLWTYGIHVVTKVTWDTCAYVARYVTKKLNNGFDDLPDKLNYPKEFSLMSRKPGIGYQFFKDNIKSYLDNGEAVLPTDKGSRVIRTNKYYSHLFDVEYPDYNYCRKQLNQEAAVNDFKVKNLTTGLSYKQINGNRAINLKAKTINFSRKGV